MRSLTAAVPPATAALGATAATEGEIEGKTYTNEDLKGGMLLGAVTRDMPADQETQLAEALSVYSRKGYFVLITSIDNQPVTTQQRYVNLASQIGSGRQVEVTHYDVSTEQPDKGPFTETLHAP